MAVVPYYPGNFNTIVWCIQNLARQSFPVHVVLLANNSPAWEVARLRKLCRRYFRFTRHKYDVRDLGVVKGYQTDARVTKKSGIISKVYNIGHDLAKAWNKDFVFIVPGDVLLIPDSLFVMVETFRQVPDAGVVCLTCYFRNKLENMPMVLPLKEVGFVDQETYNKNPIYEARAGNGAMLYRTETAQKVHWRTHDLDPLEGMGADYQLCEDIRLQLGLKCLIRSDIEVIHADEDGTLYYSGRVPEASKVRDAELRHS